MAHHACSWISFQRTSYTASIIFYSLWSRGREEVLARCFTPQKQRNANDAHWLISRSTPQDSSCLDEAIPAGFSDDISRQHDLLGLGLYVALSTLLPEWDRKRMEYKNHVSFCLAFLLCIFFSSSYVYAFTCMDSSSRFSVYVVIYHWVYVLDRKRHIALYVYNAHCRPYQFLFALVPKALSAFLSHRTARPSSMWACINENKKIK